MQRARASGRRAHMESIMKIFISSTVYELIDLRAEVYSYLKELGAEPVLSDIVESDFEIDYQKSSIETCLENVRKTEYFILILDKRYGHTLEKYGYNAISPTHLEYKEAISTKKKMIVFFRDRTYSDYSIFKKGGSRKPFSGLWIEEKENGIFDLISEHISLKQKDSNNWFYTFVSSIDLKIQLGKIFRKAVLMERLPQYIAEGIVPILDIDVKIDFQQPQNILDWKISCFIQNNGRNACFIRQFGWKNDIENYNSEYDILMPGEKNLIIFISSGATTATNNLIIDYSTYDGIRIKDEYLVEARVKGIPFNGVITSEKRLSRQITIEEPIKIDVVS